MRLQLLCISVIFAKSKTNYQSSPLLRRQRLRPAHYSSTNSTNTCNVVSCESTTNSIETPTVLGPFGQRIILRLVLLKAHSLCNLGVQPARINQRYFFYWTLFQWCFGLFLFSVNLLAKHAYVKVFSFAVTLLACT